MILKILSTQIFTESDVVLVRQRARDLARLVGFDTQEQTKVATAVSEIARNAYQYAGGGRAEFSVDNSAPPSLHILIQDQGPGIPHLSKILSGHYSSTTGMGVGMNGARRLMDDLTIDTSPGKGTGVRLIKKFARGAPTLDSQKLKDITQELVSLSVSQSPLQELKLQNTELFKALEQLQEKQTQLEDLNRELEDTNRGVVALYAELEEKADALRRASSAKTSFLSNMTHEFRTPLNSILQLTRFLIERMDGPLEPEQEKQIRLIRGAAQNLWEMVNDLLDLSKVEAGKIAVRPSRFSLEEHFFALRALMKPLTAQHPEVNLSIDPPSEPVEIFSDEGKFSQIMRNLISNALKYTTQGEVRVQAQVVNSGEAQDRMLHIEVSDTGIGIAEQDQERIFEEFVQIESSLQRQHKGTGLGLSLTRKLVQLLGGKIEVKSQLGVGTTFSVALPVAYSGPMEGDYIATASPGLKTHIMSTPLPESQPIGAKRARILMIDDKEEDRYFLKSVLKSQFDCEIAEASAAKEGLAIAEIFDPILIFIDLAMPEIDGFELLNLIRNHTKLQNRAVIVHSGMELGETERTKLASAQAILSKTDLSEE